jgi:O-6-methylguanine DNA methyltransferase
MQAIVESNAVRAKRTRYRVEGWGEGELWTSGRLVLAHEFDFLEPSGEPTSLSDEARRHGRGHPGGVASPPRGGAKPPLETLLQAERHMGDGSVSTSSRGGGAKVTPLPPGEVDALVERLAAFLAGSHVAFDDVALDLSWCTRFQQAVARALRTVPRGEVVTYGELAALAGHAGAQRAVGSFCAQNRFVFLVPCHRVVGADGIGAYGSAGVVVKRRLLALEGVRL